MMKMTSTINEINLVADLIESYGGALTLEELYWKLKKDHDEYFSDTYWFLLFGGLIMKLSMIDVREIEEGKKTVEDLTPAQQREYKVWKANDKLFENKICQQIVDRLNEIGKIDANEIGKIIEKYSENEEEFWLMYKLTDFKWINRHLDFKIGE